MYSALAGCGANGRVLEFWLWCRETFSHHVHTRTIETNDRRRQREASRGCTSAILCAIELSLQNGTKVYGGEDVSGKCVQ